MLKSMTAYGCGKTIEKEGAFEVEIQSLNRKHLEILLTLPSELSAFEPLLRQWISASVQRGVCKVKVSASYFEQLPMTLKPNIPLARELKKGWEILAKELNLDANGLEALLARRTDLFQVEAADTLDWVEVALRKATNQALDRLNQAKVEEGEALEQEFVLRVEILKKNLAVIKEKSEKAPSRYKEKLQKVLGELFKGSEEEEERLMREVCLYAEKVDISEEMVRLDSHLEQCGHQVAGKETVRGKALEFLLQEMLREVNTIGSKAADLEVTQRVVEMKGELEKMREQVQNVE